MGALKLYKPVYAYIILIVLILLSFKDVAGWMKNTIWKWHEHSGNRFSFIGAVFLIILVCSLGIALLDSIAPPVNGYTISSEMAIAKMYIQKGCIFKVYSSYISNLPPGMVMLNVLGLLIYGYSAARMMSFLFLILLAISIYSMTRRFFHRKIALFAVTITLSTPFIIKLYFMDHPFIGSMFFGFMALYGFVNWSGNTSQVYDDNNGWLAVSGIFTAFSIWMGFYSMFTPMVLLIMIFYKILTSPKETDTRQMNYKMACFIVPFILLLLPVFIKNILIAGTPFFPFFAGNFADKLNTSVTSVKSLWGHLFPLWYIPFEDKIGLKNFFYLGPVFFLFLPGFLLLKKIGKTIRIIISHFIIFFLIYIIMGRKAGFIYTIIPSVSIIVAYIIVNLYGQKKYFYQFITGVFLLAVAMNIRTVWPGVDLQDKIDIAIGDKNREEYLYQKVPGYAVMDYINKNIPENARIFLMGETRSFYIDRQTISNDIWTKDLFVSIAKNTKKSKEFKNKLRELGITHLFINMKEVEKQKKYHSYLWNEYVRRLFKILTKKRSSLKYKDGEFYLYEL